MTLPHLGARTILFTGGRAPPTLELVRLFSQAGHRVYVAESVGANLAGHSRFCQGNYLVPPPAQQPQAFADALEKLVKQLKVDLIVPTCEEIFYVSRWKPQLEKYCEVFAPPIDVLTNLHSKYQFMQLLKALKLPTPDTVRLESAQPLAGLLSEWPSYVLKPEFSRFASKVVINRPVAEALAEVKPTSEEPWVLQQFLEGRAYCSYSVARNGRLLAHGVYPSHYRAGVGATVYFESAPIPAIQQTVEKLVQSLDYTGQISLDFICHQGTYYPIECNPRTTSGAHLFSVADQLPQAFFESSCPLIEPSGARPRMVTLAMLIYVLPRLKSWSEARQLFKKMDQAGDVVLHWDDLSPFFTQFSSLWYYLRQARKTGHSLLEASTLDIEWNGTW